MLKLSRRTRLVAIVSALAALTGTTLVFAAWTTSGGGSGYAKAGSAQALTTLDGAASTVATLYPGATGNVVVNLSNPNPYPVRVTGVSLNGANADIAPDPAHSSCTTTGVAFVNQSGLSVEVPANGSAQTTLPSAVTMSNASVDGCQGATFSIPVTVTGASSA